MKEEEIKNGLKMAEGLEIAEEKDIGLLICILPKDEANKKTIPRVIEIYGDTDFGGCVREKGLTEPLTGLSISEMERRGCTLIIKACVVFPASHDNGKWQKPYVMDINKDNPFVWSKDNKVWIDTTGLVGCSR